MDYTTKPIVRRLLFGMSLIVLGAVAGTIATLILVDGRSESWTEAGLQSGTTENESKLPGHSDSSTFAGPQNTDPPTNSSEVRNISDLSGIESDFSRSVALFNLLRTADKPTLRALIRQSAIVEPTSRRREIHTAIFRRFAELDPVGALNEIKGFQTQQQRFLVEAVFREWSVMDLDSALEAATQLGRANKSAAIAAILTTRDDLSQELRSEMAVQMGDEELGLELISESRQYDMIENPSEAFSQLLNDSMDNDYQWELLVRVAEEWIERDGLQAIAQISSEFTDRFERSKILSSIYDVIAATDPLRAFEHAQTLPVASRMLALNSLARAWAEEDYQEAWDGVSSVEALSTRRELQSTVVDTWGGQDPRGLLENLHLVPDALVKDARETAIREISRTDPEEAVGWLKKIGEGAYSSSMMYSLVLNWTQQDPEAALEWVNSEPNIANIRDRLVSQVFEELTMIDVERAMNLALEDSRGLEKEVVSRLAVRDAESAIALLPRVREEHALDAYVTVGWSLIHDNDTETVLKLADQLAKEQREPYLARTIPMWARESPKSLIDAIETLPSEALKTQSAQEMTRANEWRNNLSDEQIRYLTKFLPEEVEEPTD